MLSRARPRTRPLRRAHGRCALPPGFLALAFLLLTLLLPRFSAAAPAAEPTDLRPVIVPGREAEITALFQPYAVGEELAPGWALHSFSLDVSTINVWISGPDQSYAQLSLDHLDYAPPDARALDGFALKVVEQPPGSAAAVEALVAAIERNDDGSFWSTDVVYAGEPREHPYDLAWDRKKLVKTLGIWARDGVVFLVGLTLTLLVLVAHKLRGAQTWMKWSLLGVVILAGGLRLTLSPEVALAPWPYTRLLISAGKIFHGPGLAALHPDPVWLSDAILDSTLLFSLLAPLAVYVHARYLLDDCRAALIAALVVAILPLHLRFSHSDAAFIPSITVSSTVFALIHAATRERSQLGGWIALALLGAPLALMYDVRPLNMMYYPLLLATAFVNGGLHTDKPKADRVRVVVAFGVISAVTFGIGVPNLLEHFGAQVSEGMSLSTLSSALRVIFSPRLNELINPIFTPPGLTLLAVLGAVDLWRRGRRPLFWFLVTWLLGFLVAHAYVIPSSIYMQARYHLHLIVPYMLLVACGADASLRWLAAERERRPWLAGRRYDLVRGVGLAYVLASPLIHLHGVRYVGFNDAQEWLFVHAQRERIPAQCTVIEYTGDGADMRFRRVGSWVENGVPRERWRVVEIPRAEAGEPELPENVRALLEDPPECLYWYEGLPCVGAKPVEEPKAAACDAIEGFVELEEVAATRFESEPYDENLGEGLGDRTHIELGLFRARARD
ncbi:hypothetical protein ENSA5_12960 [Enhygromyxa salina]|uniref:Glycosyltransferase RgtA/B/C/D-like domain-containing protein n=1 Tax=Enhygromyxa salina TaxID=215803 RepID=A0A2S9YFF4_9BACT|nr:hypothetical protein [Enhygromyxa salina]PRQ03746.1 hypothetical protein ENSA5_12960 [Enhygromyxa salina]